MKASTLLRLYPRSWRERYGEEFVVLLTETGATPAQVMDVVRQAAAEWRRVTAIDVWLLPILIGGCGLVVGKTLAARMSPPLIIQALALIPSLAWATVSLGRAGWVLSVHFRGRAMPPLMPRLTTRASRVGLATALVVGVSHFWLFPSSFLWTPLMVIGNPAFMIAMFVGTARVWAHQPVPKPIVEAQPPQHPLGLG